MLIAYHSRQQKLHPIEWVEDDNALYHAHWVDLLSPTQEEEWHVQKTLGIELPTRDEMEEIEESSRLYHQNGTLYMTAVVVGGIDTNIPTNNSITFIFNSKHLITIRYADPKPFKTYMDYSLKQSLPCSTSIEICIGLLESIVDRIGDVMKSLQGKLDRISLRTFVPEQENYMTPVHANDLKQVVQDLGRHNFLSSKLRESTLSIARLLTFMKNSLKERVDKESWLRLNTLEKDVHSLSEFNNHVSAEINFLLDSTLGLINDQQNTIIRVFTIATVLFLPPTLVATWYGMNFRFMPELHWEFGYPMILCVMLLSALVPLWLFKRKGWL